MKIVINGQETEAFGIRGPAGPDGNPVGTVISYLGLTAPKDYLICDGTEYNVSGYPELAAFFKSQFGAANHFGGDGETTFAVPDMRNLFLRGYHGEAEEQLSGEVGARQEGTIHVNSFCSDYGLSAYVGAEQQTRNFDAAIGSHTNSVRSAATRGTAVYASPGHTSRPINMAVLYCIKATESYPAENVYSTEETRIGTYLNKPLYRRVISCTTPASANSEKICNPEDFSFIQELTNIYGVYSGLSINSYFGVQPHYILIRLVGNHFTAQTSHYTSESFCVTIEYTKTTD